MHALQDLQMWHFSFARLELWWVAWVAKCTGYHPGLLCQSRFCPVLQVEPLQGNVALSQIVYSKS